jgi:methylthioribose-1-phosphate isomerase
LSELTPVDKRPTQVSIKPIEWTKGAVRLLDQSRLPWEEAFLELRTPQEVARAIREMRVRGAPAIGVTAAYGMALVAMGRVSWEVTSVLADLRKAGEELAAARPTAVNLRWAVERMIRAADKVAPDGDVETSILAEAKLIHQETLEADLALSGFGAPLIGANSTVLTHCNTGPLATGGYGTALGVIRRAWEEGRVKDVMVTETRPWLQGARLTTWELTGMGIPFTLLVDSAAGYLMSRGLVQCAIVGADRIAANGDVANKIGTCSLAMLAHENNIPFYVAAPISTIDRDTPSGAHIPIEERPAEDVIRTRGISTALEGAPVWNPAFDVTPSRYIGAIITERGIVWPPDYEQGIRRLVGNG